MRRLIYSFRIACLIIAGVTYGSYAAAQCGSAYTITITTCGFYDESHFEIRNALNVVVFSQATSGTFVYSASGLPPDFGNFTFFIETQGVWNDNCANYTVTSPCGSHVTGTITGGQTFTSAPFCCNIAPPPPPPGEDCSTALAAFCGQVESGTTIGHISNPGPACGTGAGPDVWYTFTGDGQPWTISLCGSSYDTYLAVYSGPSCAALSCVVSNDDFCGLQSQVTVATVAGTQYYIMINGWGGGSGAYTMAITTPCCAPVNDNCAGATPITPGTTTGVILPCNNVDVAPNCGTASAPTAGGVWYTYTPGCSGQITATLCSPGTNYDTQLSIFNGTCGALVCVNGNNNAPCGTPSEVSWAGTASTTYYILVHGNVTAIGSYDLILSQQDLTAPVADITPLPQVLSECEVTITAPTATDNCAGTITATTVDPLTYNVNGTYNVDWVYNDGNGNTSIQTQQVIINDAIPPTITGPNDSTLSNSPGICGATFNYNAPVCAFNGLYYDQSVDNDIFDNGYFITSSYPNFIADDFIVPDGDCWNINTFSANIWEEFLGVSLSSLVVNFHSDAGGIPGPIISTQTLTSADWTSAFLGTAFGYSLSDFDFVLPTTVNVCGAPGGSTIWLSIYDNVAGATSVAWSIIQPISNYPAQQSIFGTETGPWAMNGDDFVFNIGGSTAGTVVDNCPTCATIVQTTGLPSGSVFPTGTTTNTFVATDAAGNSASYSFDVIVNDDENPVPNIDSSAAFTFSSSNLPMLIADISTSTDSLMVSGTPTVLNAGDIASVCIDIDHPWDSDMTITLISPMGTSLIISDGNGADGDDYIQTCFDMNAATNITSGSAPFIGSYIPEGAGGFNVFNGEDPNGYWKLEITDNAFGDFGVLYDFTINLDFHWDTILPVLQGECITLTPPTATDNCDSTVTATTSDSTSYTADGTYIVNWTYTDAAGNSLVQTQEVIVDDVTPAVPNVANLPTLTADCIVSKISPPGATDACTGAIIGTTTDPLTYNTAGTYIITWTYDDGNGNTSTQQQTIIVTDNIAPVPTQTILPNVIGNCTVTVSTIPTATDNCSGTITGTTNDPLFYNVVGTFFIIWTYDDGNGNTWTQNQTVVVNPCLGLQDPSGASNVLIYPNPGSGIFTLSLPETPIEETEIRFVDALGQVLYSGMLTNQVTQFDFSYLASATYFILITNNTGHISKPLIIKKDY